MKKAFFYFICLCLIACESKSIFKDAKVVKVRNFPVSINSVEEQLPILPQAISTLFVVDTFLLVKHFDRDFILSVYSTVSQRHLANLLYIGHGPNEMQDWSYFDQYKRDSSGVKLYFADVNQLKFFELDLIESCRLKTTVLTELATFPTQYLRTFYINDSTYLSRDYNMNMMRIFYGTHDRSGVMSKDWTLYEDVKNRDFNRFWSADRLRPDGTKMVIAMSEFDQINILDLQKGQNLTVTTADRLPVLEEEQRAVPICYQGVVATQDRIYALYLGQKDVPSEVQIFNWEGKPLYKLEISRLLRAFAVDPIGKQLYGVTREEEEIFRYDLSRVEE